MKASDRNNNLSKSRNLKAPRADFHDYTAPGYYLITITAYQGTPRLSTINTPCDAILRKGEMIILDNTELGERVKDELIALPKKNPKLQIRRYVIMPDHIHFVLQVVSELEKTIGRYIAPFTKTCSQAYTRISNLPNFTTLFKPFDDQIIFNKEQLDRAIKYIEDNPRRSDAGFDKFHQMNDFAAAIATLPASTRLSLRFSPNP